MDKGILSQLADLREPLQKLKNLEEIQTEIRNKEIASQEFEKFLESLYGLACATVIVYDEESKFSKIFKTEDSEERIRF